MIIDNIAR